MQIDGLHGLMFGNGGSAGATNTLFFTAGPAGGSQGLVGTLTPTPNTATIIEAPLTGSAASVSAVEGNPFVGVVATFTDSNPLSQPGDFSAMIDWGDGTPPSAGEIISGNGLGAYIVMVEGALAHTYIDETGSPLHPQPFNISVTIAETDDSGASVIVEGFRQRGRRRPAHLRHGHRPDRNRGPGKSAGSRADHALATTSSTAIPWPLPDDFIANGVTGADHDQPRATSSTDLGTIVEHRGRRQAGRELRRHRRPHLHQGRPLVDLDLGRGHWRQDDQHGRQRRCRRFAVVGNRGDADPESRASRC